MGKPTGLAVAFSCCLGFLSCRSPERIPTPATLPLILHTLLDRCEVVDLTHGLNEANPYLPVDGYHPLRVEVVETMEENKRNARIYSVPEHYGTHLDAPRHMRDEGLGVAALPLSQFVRQGIVIDMRAQVLENPDHALTLEEVLRWERKNGKIPDECIVLLRTGWASRFGSGELYLNADSSSRLRFPGFGLEAARFLLEERGAVALGIDTLGVDPGLSKDFPVHRLGADAGIYFLENLARLSELPTREFLLVVAPTKLEQASGVQVRVFAFVGN